MIKKFNRSICIILFLASLFVFTRGLSLHGLEYRDDEIFYFKSTQEMLQQGHYLSPTYFGETRFQKPILFYWFILLAYKIFGVNWFSARIVAAIFGSLTVCFTWSIAKDLFDRRIATLSAGILVTISLFFRHAKNAVPDMPLDFFIVAAIYYGLQLILSKVHENESQSIEKKDHTNSMFFFVACALGFMVKGLAAIAVPFLTIILFSCFINKPRILRSFYSLKGFLLLLAIVSPWFVYMVFRYGESYINYMLIDETKNRIVSSAQEFSLFAFIKMFLAHFCFYFRTIFSYFAPWSFFFILALPFSVWRAFSVKTSEEERRAVRFLLVWIFVVWIMFSCMYFAINHYILVMTTPFAILISYFFLKRNSNRYFLGKFINFCKRYIIIFIFPVGALAFIVLAVFLAGQNKYWLPVYGIVFLLAWINMIRSKEYLTYPLTLSIFLIFVFSQSNLMTQAGMTSHGTLQKFAKTINHDHQADYAIAVGSHDIHEKEFQVYFDKKIEKLGVSYDESTKNNLMQFSQKEENFFCLMTEKDFLKYENVLHVSDRQIVQEEYALRRRMHLDTGFAISMLTLNQERVRNYLMEKWVLIKKMKKLKS